ncbi:MAG: hypothetical protein R3C26_11870 [Calditrichia bacterium]
MDGRRYKQVRGMGSLGAKCSKRVMTVISRVLRSG